GGRDAFYAYRRKLLLDKPDGFVPPAKKGAALWPIVATHMGVTGTRRASMRSHMTEYGREATNPFSVRLRFDRVKAGRFKEELFGENVFFNASSIGLYDEDIEEVVGSGGLIGVSLDARILGYQSLTQRLGQDHDYDYFSREDFAVLFPDLASSLPILRELAEPTTNTAELTQPVFGNEALVATNRRTRELYLFCLNVLHIVAVTKAITPVVAEPWRYVCIGSDYDGLIDSLQAARTIEQMPAFRRELLNFFPAAEKAYRKLRPAVGDLLPRSGGNPDVENVLEALFYENGRRFLEEWWAKT
ncbi:MAG TPA: hypothetical protein VF598_09670, partial [Hymenobacter sp.]